MDYDDFYTYAVAACLTVMAAVIGLGWMHPRKDDPPCDEDASPPP